MSDKNLSRRSLFATTGAMAAMAWSTNVMMGNDRETLNESPESGEYNKEKYTMVQQQAATGLAFRLCADFALLPDDTALGPQFSLAGFIFQDLGGTIASFVNETGTEKGLQFHDSGLEVVLPVPVSQVELRLGTFAGPVDIAAVDSTGTTVRTRTVPGTNSYGTVRLFAPEIASIVFTQGGNEAILTEICINLTVC